MRTGGRRASRPSSTASDDEDDDESECTSRVSDSSFLQRLDRLRGTTTTTRTHSTPPSPSRRADAAARPPRGGVPKPYQCWAEGFELFRACDSMMRGLNPEECETRLREDPSREVLWSVSLGPNLPDLTWSTEVLHERRVFYRVANDERASRLSSASAGHSRAARATKVWQNAGGNGLKHAASNPCTRYRHRSEGYTARLYCLPHDWRFLHALPIPNFQATLEMAQRRFPILTTATLKVVLADTSVCMRSAQLSLRQAEDVYDFLHALHRNKHKPKHLVTRAYGDLAFGVCANEEQGVRLEALVRALGEPIALSLVTLDRPSLLIRRLENARTQGFSSRGGPSADFFGASSSRPRRGPGATTSTTTLSRHDETREDSKSDFMSQTIPTPDLERSTPPSPSFSPISALSAPIKSDAFWGVSVFSLDEGPPAPGSLHALPTSTSSSDARSRPFSTRFAQISKRRRLLEEEEEWSDDRV